jgi:acetoin utilization deacetylase AcuC-like enzyme
VATTALRWCDRLDIMRASDRAMGFCLLNNVAIAAAAVRATGRRVAIVDFDVHHGNGTEDIFARDGSVLVISLHQFPFYPGSGAATSIGEGNGRGFIVNIPLPEVECRSRVQAGM